MVTATSHSGLSARKTPSPRQFSGTVPSQRGDGSWSENSVPASHRVRTELLISDFRAHIPKPLTVSRQAAPVRPSWCPSSQSSVGPAAGWPRGAGRHARRPQDTVFVLDGPHRSVLKLVSLIPVFLCGRKKIL